jgi:hypothetical protein
MPKLRDVPPDQATCLVPFVEVKIKPVNAYYSACMDWCNICGSSGASNTILFCVDCVGNHFIHFVTMLPCIVRSFTYISRRQTGLQPVCPFNHYDSRNDYDV